MRYMWGQLQREAEEDASWRRHYIEESDKVAEAVDLAWLYYHPAEAQWAREATALASLAVLELTLGQLDAELAEVRIFGRYEPATELHAGVLIGTHD